MKKAWIIILIIIIFNFIFNSFAFATEEGASTVDGSSVYQSLSGNGHETIETSDGPISKKVGVTDSTIGSGMGMLSSLSVPYAAVITEFILTGISMDGGLYRTESKYSAENTGIFTICSLVFGEFLLFNGKIYQTNENLNPGIERKDVAKIMDETKIKAAAMFNTLRTIGLCITLPMLVYALIRIFTSSVAADLAGWKKVLGNWIVCFIFLYFAQYIIIAINAINDLLMDILWNARITLENNNYQNFEVSLFSTSVENFNQTSGILSFGYSVEYLAIVIFQILFFGKYIIRAFGMIILVTIAPIFGVIHAYNIMSGKNGTILRDWLKTYCSLLFMQPIHALLYLIFMFTASQIAINAPLLGVMFLYALFRAEKVTHLMLGMQGTSIFDLFRK